MNKLEYQRTCRVADIVLSDEAQGIFDKYLGADQVLLLADEKSLLTAWGLVEMYESRDFGDGLLFVGITERGKELRKFQRDRREQEITERCRWVDAHNTAREANISARWSAVAAVCAAASSLVSLLIQLCS